MDYSSFFYSIAGCSATIIAIIGGFIASKLISISADRDNILDKIKEINDELNMKTKQHDDIIEKLDDDDALDFVRDNVSMLVDHRSIDIVYKPEEKPKLDYFKMERYWVRALKICEEIFDLNEEQVCDVNSDKYRWYWQKSIQMNLIMGFVKKCYLRLKRGQKSEVQIHYYFLHH